MSPTTDAKMAPRPALPWHWLSMVSLAALAAALIAFGWDRGPDVLIDFGRELYVPWRLVEGEHLHTDIAWFNGPAGPWIIEGWMRLVGVSLDALQALNTLVILTTLALLVSLVRKIADALTAWAAGVVFLAVFAVAQQEATGNFLFLAPYSHGITFGFLFALGALWALVRATSSPAWWPPLVSGVCCGLAFLTKAEISVAVGAALAVGFAALSRSNTIAARRPRLMGLFALGLALPIAAAYARFVHQIGSEGALRALAGTWPYAFDERVRDLDFYQSMRGLDDPRAHLVRIARQTVGSAAVIATLMAAASFVGARLSSKRMAAVVALLSIGAASMGVLLFAQLRWLLVPLPLVVAAVLVLSCVRWLRERESSDASPALAQLTLCVFAGALLLKILLQVLARQYGFVLSIPATLLLVVVLVQWLPEFLARRLGSAPNRLVALRAAGLAMVLAFTAANFNATRNLFLRKTFVVGEGSDRFLSDGWRGTIIGALTQQVRRYLKPGDTLLVLPEGISVNYLVRARTPTPVVNFMPPELIFFEESRIVAALEANPPDVVAFVHRPTDIYGYPFFGDGYGEAVIGWVRARYERVVSIGGEPFEEGPNGAAVLLPKDRAPR